MSPLPNPKLWNSYTTGFLQTQESFINGGWWHDEHILEATGQGIVKEEPRGWQGWWNEQIVRCRPRWGTSNLGVKGRACEAQF